MTESIQILARIRKLPNLSLDNRVCEVMDSLLQSQTPNALADMSGTFVQMFMKMWVS